MSWLGQKLRNIFKRGTSGVDEDPLRPEGNYISPEVPRRVVVEKPDVDSEPYLKIALQHLRIPNNEILIEDFETTLKQGDRVMLIGPSGSGKSTLFRAVAGLWPYGEGRIEHPKESHVMVLPQSPHLPLLDLEGVLCYPREHNPYTREEMEQMLKVVGLDKLIDVLDMDHVNGVMLDNMLSGGEKQRLAFARLFLAKPEIVFLDECTSALDTDWQARMYEELLQQLPHSIIVSISHRAELLQYHETSMTLDKDKKITIAPVEKVDSKFLSKDAAAKTTQNKPPAP